MQAIRVYSERSWPYTVLLIVFSATLAIRMQIRPRSKRNSADWERLRRRQNIADILWMVVLITGLNAWVVSYEVKYGYSPRSGVEFWIRILSPVMSLVAGGAFVAYWFRAAHKPDAPNLDEVFRRLKIGWSEERVKHEFSEKQLNIGEDSEKISGGSEFDADRAQANELLIAYFYQMDVESGWIYILGFGRDRCLAFKTEGSPS
jgi:hypothetical protein